MGSPLEAALARHRALTIAALILLILLAWIWIFAGAGMGMEPLASLAPLSSDGAPAMDMDMGGAAPTGWSPGQSVLVVSMWWIMMVAMMLPSAAPVILLYARANAPGTRPASGSFVAGYLLAWGAFSLAAALLQWALEHGGLLDPMAMASQSRRLTAVVLIAAGAYQLSPLKDVCLRHCRNPAVFLSQHYRPGRTGALRMGLIHGTYCVGCCWLLMALLFVGGVMNLAWIALLTLMVAIEKLLPFGRIVAIAAGFGCIGWGTAILFG